MKARERAPGEVQWISNLQLRELVVTQWENEGPISNEIEQHLFSFWIRREVPTGQNKESPICGACQDNGNSAVGGFVERG